MILPIVQSRIVSIAMALVLIGLAIHDIYDDLFKPAHEHLLMILGVFMAIGAFGHLNENVAKFAHIVQPDRKVKASEKITAFFQLPIVRIILGLNVIAAATYGLYQDYEKMETKSVSMGIGIFTMLGPLYKMVAGGEKVAGGLKREPRK